MGDSRVTRFAEIDALRGLAALGVLLYHLGVRHPRIREGGGEEAFYHLFALEWLVVPERYIGEIPVYVFFMISGFIMFATAPKCSSVKEFLVRRFSRLYPAYWVAVLMTTSVLVLFSSYRDLELSQILANLTMWQGYMRVSPVDGAYWSLTVELSFYFLVTLVLYLGWFKHYKIILTIWSLVIVAYGFFGIPNPIPWPIVYLFVLDYGHFFIIGIAFHLIWQNDGKFSRFAIFLIVTTLCSTMLRHAPGVSLIMFLMYFLFFLIIRNKLPVLNNSILLWLGGISYPLYLVHQEIGYTIMDALQGTRLFSMMVATVVVCILAWCIHKLVERPSQTIIRKYLFYK